MSPGRPRVLLVTPVPPMETGLATYALRVLDGTGDLFDWTVAYPEGGDPGGLPEGIASLPLEEVPGREDLPGARLFQLGNSVHCFEVVRLLYRTGGSALFHELVLHHMLRHCYLERGMEEEYMRELRYCYGPSAGRVAEELSRPPRSDLEYDRRLKRYPLIGRAVGSCSSAACLNRASYRALAPCFPADRLTTVGHPLSPLPPTTEFEAPFSPVVGMVGGWHPSRNLRHAVEVVRELRETLPGAGLLVAGGGWPDPGVDWAVVTGRLPEPEYQAAIREMDLVLDLRHPSCGETSGSLLEAMRAGVPCVVTATGSFLYIPSGAVMRVSPEGLPGSAAAAAALLLRDRALASGLGAGGAEHARREGGRERMRSDWERLVSMAASGAEGAPAPGSRPRSLAAAWHGVPAGMGRELGGRAVTWTFEGEALVEGPADARGARVTISGSGEVNGVPLPERPAVISVRGGELRLSGRGAVTAVLWEREGGEVHGA